MAAVLMLGLAGCDPAVEPGATGPTNPQYVALASAAMTAAIADIGGPWSEGEGTLVLETEPLARLVPVDPENGPSQADILLAFANVARSHGLATDEGASQDFLQCRDRASAVDECEMDTATMLVAPGRPIAQADGAWMMTFSTKYMQEEGVRAWVTHYVTLDQDGERWIPIDHQKGYGH